MMNVAFAAPSDKGNAKNGNSNNNNNFQNYLTMVKNKMNDDVKMFSQRFSSVNKSIQGQKMYSEIQRDIASWKSRLQKGHAVEASTHEELIYVDKTRALAVMAGGDQDLRNQVSELEKQHLASVNRQHSLSWTVHFKEGLLNFKRTRYDLALKSFCNGIKKDNNHEELYIYRCRTYLALNSPEKALKDAEEAISINRLSFQDIQDRTERVDDVKSALKKLDYNYIWALSGKAEALFQMMEFEKALVYFYRSLYRRSDSTVIQQGVKKTILSLENCLDDRIFNDFDNLTYVIQNVGYSRDETELLNKCITKFKSTAAESESKENILIFSSLFSIQTERRLETIKENGRNPKPSKWRSSRRKNNHKKILFKNKSNNDPNPTARHLSTDINFIKRLLEDQSLFGAFPEGESLANGAMEFLTDRKKFWLTQGNI